MRIEEFYYPLPQELIAQEPLPKREVSRLMVVERKREKISHHYFYEILSYLKKGDILVLNDAKVIPARLRGRKKKTGGKVEILLLKEKEPSTWFCLARGRRIKEGEVIVFAGGLEGEVIGEEKEKKIIHFSTREDLLKILEKIGEVPLPPYIKKPTPLSWKRYQTVYARREGAVAAPTAGLHFSKELLEKIKDKGVYITYLTLLVGWGTFAPIRVKEVERHSMEEEYFEISPSTAEKINTLRKKGGRLVAVGTTTVRALESSAKQGEVRPFQGWTSLFIYPGYQFKVVDILLTNFHLPSSTPLLLTCAFGGRDLVLKAYQEAVKERYRFYSFGDAMLIL